MLPTPLPREPLSNEEIQALEPCEVAQMVAHYLDWMNLSDDNCPWSGRRFDDLWENGRVDEIAKEFIKLIDADAMLKADAINFGGGKWITHLRTL